MFSGLLLMSNLVPETYYHSEQHKGRVLLGGRERGEGVAREGKLQELN